MMDVELTDDEAFEEYRACFAEDQWLGVEQLLKQEEKRSGVSFQQLLLNVCRFADEEMWGDQANRDFPTFVWDYVVYATQEVERLTLEEGMKKQGGRVEAKLVSQEEMEAQRKALFKPVLSQKKGKDPRGNKRRQELLKKRRGMGQNTFAHEFDPEVFNNFVLMGHSEEQVLQCLRAAHGDPDRAAEFLADGIPGVPQN
jgi:hypothetical protein